MKATTVSGYVLKLGILGVDWDEKTKAKAIYKITAPGHKGWSKNVDSELGNYDYLLGVDVGSFLPTYL